VRAKCPKPRTWVAIKRAYEKGSSVNSLAKRFRTSRNTITSRRNKEAWVVEPQAVEQMLKNSAATTREYATAMRSKVIDMQTRRALERVGEKNVHAAVDTLQDLLERQIPLAARMQTFAEGILTRVESGELQALGRDTSSALISAACHAARISVEITRSISGLKEGQASVAIGKLRHKHLVITVAKPKESLEHTA
jgi:hypothetical protein